MFEKLNNCAYVIPFSVENVILYAFEVSLGQCSVYYSRDNGRHMVSEAKGNN